MLQTEPSLVGSPRPAGANWSASLACLCLPDHALWYQLKVLSFLPPARSNEPDMGFLRLVRLSKLPWYDLELLP